MLDALKNLWLNVQDFAGEWTPQIYRAADYIRGITWAQDLTGGFSLVRFLVGEPIWYTMVTLLYIGLILVALSIIKAIITFFRNLIPLL